MSPDTNHQLDYRLDGEKVQVLNRVLLALGLACLGAAGVGAMASEQGGLHFKFSYLTSYAFYVSISLGALFFVLVTHVCSARWSVVIRRLSEAVMMNFWLMLILLIPILFWMEDLYAWADHAHTADDPLLQEKQAYLNIPFFMVRLAIYFFIWIGLARFMYRRSLLQDATGEWRLLASMRRMSAPGLILFALSLTFFAFDLLMSLDPHWYSTIFGVYYFAGAVLGGLSTLILVSVIIMTSGAVGPAITIEHLHDLGKLLFGFVVFWAYIAFSQLLLIWMANIPEETIWYIHRFEGSWRWLSYFLIIGHFVLPFFFLVSYHAKRNRVTISLAALWILAMHYLDLYWIVLPTFDRHGVPWSTIDPFVLLSMGCLFIYVLVDRLVQRPLVPVRDPYLADSIAFENV